MSRFSFCQIFSIFHKEDFGTDIVRRLTKFPNLAKDKSLVLVDCFPNANTSQLFGLGDFIPA